MAPEPSPPVAPHVLCEGSADDITIQVGDTSFVRLELAMAIFVLLVVGTLCAIAVCRWLYLSSLLKKVLAPRMRKKGWEEQGVSGFLSSEGGMEDADPEIQMNPVLVHKMERNKAAGRKQKGVGVPQAGGLAKLGLSIKSKEPPPEKTQGSKLDELVAVQGTITPRAAAPASATRRPADVDATAKL